ncbi:OB-fold putative lipoprotein [Patescibacteria group bacterium]|nr:OB-fold putative lipoprotein [Patescibacteria group bacterium]
MKKILKIVGGIFLVLIILGVIGAITGGSKKTPTENSGAAKETANTNNAPQAVEPTKIQASELADDFDANQVAAKEKWNGKLVEFTAAVSNITESGLSFTGIASKQFSLTQISCAVTDKQQLMPLKNGQMVTVRGTVGDQMLGVISIKDCSVVQ